MKEEWKYLNEAKSLKEAVYRIPERWRQCSATLLLAFLCVIPVIASITYDPLEVHLYDYPAGTSELLSTIFDSSDNWYYLMWYLAFTGIVFLCYSILKSMYDAREMGQNIKSWVKTHWSVCFFAALACWAFLSFLQSSDHQRSFFGTGYRHDGMLSYFIYASIFAMAIQLGRKHMRFLMELLNIVGGFLGILAITKGNFLPQIFHYATDDYRASIFNQYNHFGYFLEICVPLCAVLLLTDAEYGLKGWKKWLLGIIRILQFWLITDTLVYNGVRGAFGGVVVALLALNLFVFAARRRYWKRMLLADGIFLLTLFGINTGNTILGRLSIMGSLFTTVFQEKGLADMSVHDFDSVGSARAIMWQYGIEFATQKPLFGYGPDNLGMSYCLKEQFYTDRPHNEYIQIAASLGIPALFFYLAGLWNHLLDFIRAFRRLSIFQIGLFVICGSYLAGAFFGNSMFYTTPYFYLFLGMSYVEVKNTMLSVTKE